MEVKLPGTRLSMQDPNHVMFRTLDFYPRVLGIPLLNKVTNRGMSQVLIVLESSLWPLSGEGLGSGTEREGVRW